jgi:hypothetical protein
MYHYKTLTLFIAFICFNSYLTNAQSNNNYKRLSGNFQAQKAALDEINNRYKTILQNLPADYKDQYKALYKDMQTEKIKYVTKEAYLFNDTLQRYFNAILAEIKRGNPSLPISTIPFYVSRDYSPNAATSLDGSITFNLSLIADCKNESQVAFVICHELAHHQLKHPHKSVKKMFDMLYSKQGQNKLKEIAKSEYNTLEQVEKYLKSAIYDSRRHGRENEEQADSLAIKYLLNTRYNPKESATCLLMLDQIDSLTYAPNFDLTVVFSTPQYKFKKSWIEEEETMFSNGKRVFDGELNKDSLKTHPSCVKRAELATNYCKNAALQSSLNNPQSHALFENLRLKAEYETLIAAYDSDDIDYCLFQTLKSLQNHPNNIFLTALVGQCLNAVYDGQKTHTLSKLVAIPAKTKPKTYLPFLRFLNNMSLSEIASVNYQFMNKQDKTLLKDEFFLFNMLLAAKNAGQKEDFKTYKSLFLKSFPKDERWESVSKMQLQ